MASYSVLLRSDQAVAAQRLEYASDEEVFPFDIILLDGVRVLIDEISEPEGSVPVLHCRRLWRLRLRDRNRNPVGAGFILNEQRHFGSVETLIFEGGERFRLLHVEPDWPEDFDGSLVVEPFPLEGQY